MNYNPCLGSPSWWPTDEVAIGVVATIVGVKIALSVVAVRIVVVVMIVIHNFPFVVVGI